LKNTEEKRFDTETIKKGFIECAVPARFKQKEKTRGYILVQDPHNSVRLIIKKELNV
jgi:hypothetical protein